MNFDPTSRVEKLPIERGTPEGVRPRGIGSEIGQYPGYPSMPVESDQFDIKQLARALWRRKFMIAGLTLFVTVLAALWANQIDPLYRAKSAIIVEPNRTNLIDVKEVVEAMRNDRLTIETQAAVIASRQLGRQVVERLNLAEDPRYNPLLARPKVRGPIGRWLDDMGATVSGTIWGWIEGLGLTDVAHELGLERLLEPAEEADASKPLQMDPNLLLDRLTDRFLGGLFVEPAEGSREITIRYIAGDPVMAALAANTVAEVYLESQQTEKGRGTTQAAAWLDGRVAQSQTALIDSERRLEEFRSDIGITEIDGSSLPARQLAEFDTELSRSRTSLAEKQARYDQVQRLLQGGSQDLETAAAVMESSLVQNLRVQEVEVNRKLDELRVELRENHPRLMQVKAELAGLQDKIKLEVKKIAASLRNELEVANIRVQNLRLEVRRLKNQIQQLNKATVELRSRENEVEANRELYQTLLERVREIDIQDETFQSADARIISLAVAPRGPFYPRKGQMVAMAFMASLILGSILALLPEFLHSGFRSLGQIERLTGIPGIGMIPLLKLRKNDEAFSHAHQRKDPLYAEAIRSLRTALMLSDPDRPPRIVMATSSVPNEGKTSTVLSIATQAVESGRKCIVLECDLRNPTVGSYLGVKPGMGLSDVLRGTATLEQVINVDPRSNVHFVSAGSRLGDPLELIASPQMERVLRDLAVDYELVLLDSPPLLAVSDGQMLIRLVDSVLFLVRWEKTKRESVLAGIRIAIESGVPIAGTVLTQVDTRKYARYGYYNSGIYYDKSYQKYYARV